MKELFEVAIAENVDGQAMTFLRAFVVEFQGVASPAFSLYRSRADLLRDRERDRQRDRHRQTGRQTDRQTGVDR